MKDTRVADVVVVGGGIAGLYYAYQTARRYPSRSIVVLEADERWGGRLCTVMTPDGVQLEAGASILGRHQSITDFFEQVLRVPLAFFEPHGTECPNDVPSVTDMSLSLDRPTPGESVQQWLQRILDNDDKLEFMARFTPAWYEVANQNARVFLDGEMTTTEYAHPTGGMTMSGAIDRLVSLLLSLKVGLYSRHRVVGIDKTENKCDVRCLDGPVWHARHVHLALPKTAAVHIQGLPPAFHHLMDTLYPLSSLRVYMVTRDKHDMDALMRDMTQVTGGDFHWALRTGERTLLASYCDGERADDLYAILKPPLRHEVVATWMHDMASRCTGGVVPGDFDVHVFYWEEACTFIHHYVNEHVYTHLQTHALPAGMSESISPKDFGRSQAWIEAHIKSP